MFGLFQGRKARTKKKIIKALDEYIPGIEAKCLSVRFDIKIFLRFVH